MDLTSSKQLIIREMASSEGWQELERIISLDIENLYKKILKAETFEEVLEARAQIKCYQRIMNLVRWSDDDKRPIA